MSSPLVLGVSVIGVMTALIVIAATAERWQERKRREQEWAEREKQQRREKAENEGLKSGGW